MAVVTPVRKARYQAGLTPGRLAARCQMSGVVISRATLAQIESRHWYVSDEVLFLLIIHVTALNSWPPVFYRDGPLGQRRECPENEQPQTATFPAWVVLPRPRTGRRQMLPFPVHRF